MFGKLKDIMVGMTALAVIALLPSCSADGPDYEPEGAPTEWVDVEFSLNLTPAGVATRAEGSGDPLTYIGNGREIDMLVYAVYMAEETEGLVDADGDADGYTQLTQYGLGLVGLNYKDASGNDVKTQPFDPEITPALKDGKEHVGQTIVNLGTTLAEGGSFPLTLRLMRNKQYRLVFWAQSSQCDAYDTNDLRHVKISYEGAGNNDESRDAFCKAEAMTVFTGNISRTIGLTRPFAQINVGTTGKDYFESGEPILYSKVELSGVADEMNVVLNKISDRRTNATFSFTEIPGDVYFQILKDNSKVEDYLYVDLDRDGKLKPYNVTNSTVTKNNGAYVYPTETFKYLSMCYVLVPTGEMNEDGDPADISENSLSTCTLDKVSIYISEDKETGSGQEATYELNNVPVYRNWRTNILGGLTGEASGTQSVIVNNDR